MKVDYKQVKITGLALLVLAAVCCGADSQEGSLSGKGSLSGSKNEGSISRQARKDEKQGDKDSVALYAHAFRAAAQCKDRDEDGIKVRNITVFLRPLLEEQRANVSEFCHDLLFHDSCEQASGKIMLVTELFSQLSAEEVKELTLDSDILSRLTLGDIQPLIACSRSKRQSLLAMRLKLQEPSVISLWMRKDDLSSAAYSDAGEAHDLVLAYLSSAGISRDKIDVAWWSAITSHQPLAAIKRALKVMPSDLSFLNVGRGHGASHADAADILVSILNHFDRAKDSPLLDPYVDEMMERWSGDENYSKRIEIIQLFPWNWLGPTLNPQAPVLFDILNRVR